MTEKRSYPGIDCFRFIAALLIVSIHTSPLATFSETGDFILTRIVARIGVPFFLMTSGFFLISQYTRNEQKLGAFVKKTALLYGAAMLIYIPVNIYSGYLKTEALLPTIIKDVLFDGTFYHLWYLPASIIGAVIAWYLVKKLHYAKALTFTAILYGIGLFGDSYYGLAERLPFLQSFYRSIFQIFDYTRNGLFFAPIFFVLGGLIADRRTELSFTKSVSGFIVSFTCMFCEAMTLHHFNLQRHDSMYVFLLPCMYFLFNVLLHYEGKRYAGLRTASLLIYIIHPMMIVFVRLLAKVFHLQSLFIDNSGVHFILVCLTSVIFSWVGTIFLNRFKRNKEKYIPGTDRAYVEIDLNNLEHNVRVLKEALPPQCELMAVVKAEAYGHGAYEIATYINRLGVHAYAVATIDEGIELRNYGITGEILILGYTSPARAKELLKFDLTQTLIDYDYSLRLNEQGYNVKAHIKIDTGMHRLGFETEEIDKISSVFRLKHIRVCGIFTHLCACDSLTDDDISFTHLQIERYYKLLDSLKAEGISIPKVHIQSSYGLLNYSELKCDYVRVGISLYGVPSSSDTEIKLHLDLKPVLSLKSRVILLRTIKKEDAVGYNRAFVAEKDSVIAVLPIGYADGVPRNLSCGKGYVLINGHKAPFVGKICMDQLAVDVTDIPDVKIGMTATLIGKDGDEEILATAVADHAESITNELLSRMGRRLKTVTVYNHPSDH